MRFLLTISFALWLGSAQAESVRILVQNSPLAGSQYYAVGEFWSASSLPLSRARPESSSELASFRRFMAWVRLG